MLVLAATLARSMPAFAFGQLPLVSEDPSSPCRSTLDTAIAYSMDLVGPGHDSFGQQRFRSHLDMAAPLVQINYGITDRLQGRIAGDALLTTVAPSGGGFVGGFGDFSGGLKYRFMDQIDGLEYGDTCDPQQSEAPYGLQGPVSVSVFPQLSFPTGSQYKGLGSGGYSLEIPVDIAREIGNLYLIGEGNFVWEYHDRTSANEIQAGIAGYYTLSSRWELLGEQRLAFATSGRGASLWLMNVGADYQLNRHVMLFGAAGTSIAATSTLTPSYLTTIIGIDITVPVDW